MCESRPIHGALACQLAGPSPARALSSVQPWTWTPLLATDPAPFTCFYLGPHYNLHFMGTEFLLEMKNRGDSCTRLNALNTAELQHLRMVKTANVTLLYYSKKKNCTKHSTPWSSTHTPRMTLRMQSALLCKGLIFYILIFLNHSAHVTAWFPEPAICHGPLPAW